MTKLKYFLNLLLVCINIKLPVKVISIIFIRLLSQIYNFLLKILVKISVYQIIISLNLNQIIFLNIIVNNNVIKDIYYNKNQMINYFVNKVVIMDISFKQ